ncbi:MAG TPA: flavin reductase family protein [Gemmatimonas sp.]|uniref:flavin reductase family protein n=1 Tax=Gemmatimonas sp. TaxID=1962908 RepID=UPI002EDBA883
MIDHDLFRAVLGRFASGVTVVTARDAAGNPHGMTVSAFSSLSLDPPLVLVCIGNDASTAPVMAQAESFAVNVLRDDQEALSRRFASPMSHRFDGIGYGGGESDPRLEGVLAWMQCRVVARHPSGDHVIYVGEVEHAGMSDGRPLLYYRGGYATLER